MSELKYNFGGIEGAASASLDDGNVDSLASTGDEGQTVQVANVWGGSGSEAYQATQQRWDSTAAELNYALSDLSSKVGEAGSSMQQTETQVTGMFASTGDGAQSGDDINIGVGELQECTISKSMDSVSHDAFDFKAMEESEAAGTQIKTFLCPSNRTSHDGDGVDDLATYQPDTTAIGPGESFTYTLDPREVGASDGADYSGSHLLYQDVMIPTLDTGSWLM